MLIEDRLARIESKLNITPPQVTIDDVYKHLVSQGLLIQSILRTLQAMTAEDQALTDAFTAYSTQATERDTVIQEALVKLAAAPSPDPTVADIASKLSAAVASAQPALDALKSAVETSTGTTVPPTTTTGTPVTQ